MDALDPDASGPSPLLDEGERLGVLRRHRILDTEPEPQFDGVARLAAQVADTPMALVTFIDEHRQWFKASVGWSLHETPRAVAFCATTVEAGQPLEVPDALKDSRFHDNPLVVGAPKLRFYAGFPLVCEGQAIGTVAVLDTRPRALTPAQFASLSAIAQQTSQLLEVRRRLADIREGQKISLSTQRALEADIATRTHELERTTEQLGFMQQLYRSLWETTNDAVLIIDAQSMIRYANPSVRRVFGYAPEDLRGGPLSQVQPIHLRQAHARGMAEYQRTGVRRVDWRAAEATGLHRDGHAVPLEISFSEIALEGERLFVGFMRDISERHKADKALRQAREQAESTLRCIGDGVVTLDAELRITSLNPAAEQLTGITGEAARGHACGDVLRLVDPLLGDAIPLPFDIDTGTGMDATPLPASALLLHASGTRTPVEGSVAALSCTDGPKQGWVVALRDVSHARELAAQVAYQAAHDALTGLVNRAEFDRRLRVSVQSAPERRQPTSLLYLDLDQFKLVNDTCGHIAGDEMLKQLASLLRQYLRTSDTLARLGGDEFGVLLENCPSDQAHRIAGKLRDAVADFKFVWETRLFATGVSIGHVHFDGGDMPAEELLRRADEACYVAKDTGRNRIHTYAADGEVQARRHGEMQWEGLVREALEHDRFALYAQPIQLVANPAAPTRHFEVLVRMTARDGSLIPPMAFIPAAERYNLMPQVDRWVVRRLLALLGRGGPDVCACNASFAVNLSGTTLSDPTFAAFITAELASSGIPSPCIGFEITETAAISNFADAIRLMQDLRAAGCTFSLDDFGSGLSSFGYLRHMPVDFLKIDGAFVRNAARDPVDRAMIASINEIGHLMGLRTIAEFVEDDSILRELRAIGVDYAQGYALGRPEPLETSLQRLLASG